MIKSKIKYIKNDYLIRFIPLLLLFLIGCKKFIETDKNQVFPNINFNDVNKIWFKNYSDSIKDIYIVENNKIKEVSNFFSDSINYFKNELVEFSASKSIGSINLIGVNDTLSLKVYPTNKKNKIELGFFEKPSTSNKWEYVKFNRFYINSKLLELIENYYYLA